MNKKQRFGLILLGTGALSFVGFMKIQKEGILGFLWMISSVLLLLFGFLLVVFGQDLKDRMEMKQRQQEENEKFRSIYSKRTQITTILGITYVIVFFATQNDSDIFSKMALNNKVFHGQIYRLISHMFVHANYMHLFGNAFVLFTVGSRLECLIGKIKYVLVYLVSGLVASIFVLVFQSNLDTVGASGALYGVLAYLIILSYINRQEMYYSFYDWLIPLAIFGCAETFFSPGISIWEHVGGFVAGLLLAYISRKKMKIEVENIVVKE